MAECSLCEYGREAHACPECYDLVHDTAKRLVAAMHMGVYVFAGDGHRWIHVDEEREEYTFPEQHLDSHKVYGGVIAALNKIDLALDKAGWPSLLQFYEKHKEDLLF
jgi:hypothetical protein